jgi:thiamine-monophosphate kinase
MSMTVSDLGERALIARLHARLDSRPAHVHLGIGDDAAVIAPDKGEHDVVTTDSLVEQVHFRRDWTPHDAIGHKALAVNLSDLAAMGATPRASLLSLILPANYPLADFDALMEGYVRLAHASGAVLVGGNISRSPGPLIVDVTAIGSARPRRLLTRADARAGDELFVTGTLGGAAAGLALLAAGRDRTSLTPDERDCVDRQERPQPRLRIGRLVGRTSAASAAMDLSDGLANGVATLAAASGVSAVVEAGSLPVHDGARMHAGRARQAPEHLALAGGEDYELLFAVPARRRGRFFAAARRCPELRITRIGRLEPGEGAWLTANGERARIPSGFEHF